jgi:hypothetical protein
MFVGILEHHEAHGAIDGGDDQRGIGHGRVIGNQQSAAARRDFFRADDVHAIKRVRGKPEQQAQKRVGQQPKRVRTHCERKQSSPNEKRPETDMQVMREPGIDD